MLTSKANFTVTVTRRTATKTLGVESETTSAIYTAVSCFVTRNRGTLRSESVERTVVGECVVVLQIDKTGVLPGDILTVSDGAVYQAVGVKKNTVFPMGNVQVYCNKK